MPTKRCFPKRPIEASARRVAKPTMWNAGIIPAANRTHATFVRPYRFQSPISITNWLLDYLSSATISPDHHFQLNHYPKIYPKQRCSKKTAMSPTVLAHCAGSPPDESMCTSVNCMMLAIWSLDDRSNFISPIRNTIVRNATSIL